MTNEIKFSDRLAGVSLTVNGHTFHYEAHSLNRVAEILAGQLDVMRLGVNEYGITTYTHEIENISLNYFIERG